MELIENAIAKTLGKRFAIPLDFKYFKQPVSPYYLHKDLIVTIQLNKSEKVMPCSNEAVGTYTISDKSLEYDVIINAQYTEKISRAQQNSSYSYTRVTRLSYQQLSRKDTSWLIDTKLQAKSLQGLLLLFLEDKADFDNKVESFYNPLIKKVNVTIDRNWHKIFKGSILPRNICPEICKNDSNVSLEEYLTTKYEPWFDTRLSVDNKLHGSGRLKNSGVRLQIDKVEESDRNLTCYIFAVQDAYVHLSEAINLWVLTITFHENKAVELYYFTVDWSIFTSPHNLSQKFHWQSQDLLHQRC